MVCLALAVFLQVTRQVGCLDWWFGFGFEPFPASGWR